VKKADDADDAAKPCYDQQALMRRYDLIAEVCGARTRSGRGLAAAGAGAARSAQRSAQFSFRFPLER
jgi:hypothetical protein